MLNADAFCERMTRASGSSFYYSFKVLPADKRLAFCAVYAFCRQTDDIVDATSGVPDERELQERGNALDEWAAELDACCQGRPRHPITVSLSDKMQRYDIPREPFDRIIEGVRMDLTRRRYQTFADLYEYCRRVASAPGLACIHILGFRNERTIAYAENLGVAFQLTNIIRDAGEDAAKDRIYIPQDEIRRFGCDDASFSARHASPELIELMRFQSRRAAEYYAKSRECLSDEDRPAMLCPEIMASIYGALLRRIERAGFPVLERRVRVSTASKIALALATWIRGCRAA